MFNKLPICLIVILVLCLIAECNRMSKERLYQGASEAGIATGYMANSTPGGHLGRFGNTGQGASLMQLDAMLDGNPPPM